MPARGDTIDRAERLSAALGAIDAAIESIRDFLKEYDQLHNAENCSELVYLLRCGTKSRQKSGPLGPGALQPADAIASRAGTGRE